MKVTTVSFKRNVQVRPYESATYEMTAELAEGDDVADAMTSLRDYVEDALRVYTQPKPAMPPIDDETPF